MTERALTAPASTGRARAFRIVAAVLGFVTVAATVPFAVVSFMNDADAIHRMHNTATVITFGLLVGVLLLICAWRPTEHIAAFRVVGAVNVAALAAGAISGDIVAGGSFVGVIAFAILLVLHPYRGRVLRPVGLRAEPTVLAVLAFVPGIALALTQSELQRNGVPALDPHAELHHYGVMASVGITLPLVALVACLDGSGRIVAARAVGASWTLMGAASLLLQDAVGSFDVMWSWWLVVGGLAFVALSEVAERRLDRRPEPA